MPSLCQTSRRWATLGIEAPSFEYDLDHNQAEFEKFRGECDLYDLVQDLHRIWMKNGKGGQRSYWWSCRDPVTSDNYEICTDPGLWGVISDKTRAIVPSDPLDPSTIARMQTWIKRCVQEHEDCRGEGVQVLPTRILDLGEPRSTEKVKLIETNGRRGQYIALTHCWGASNSFLTTRDTIESMKNGFFPDETPATFCDVIMLARCLQIRYLWIDSLCIIQKDIEDWNAEASRMGDVYRNAYLMVEAANASDDKEGFLKPRPDKIQCSIKVTAPTGQTANIYLRLCGVDWRSLPLDSRG